MDVNDGMPKQHKKIPQSQNSPSLQELIDNLALQSLQSSQTLFSTETHQLLSQKFSKIDQKATSAHFLAQFVTALLSYAGTLKHQLSLNSSNYDYEVLEQSIQKSEAEIRKHIKIQQQLKLYLDGLEERIQQLQYKLKLQEEKYLLLFQNFKELDQDHKKLSQQLSSVEFKRGGHQYEFKSIQTSSNENVMSRKTKLGLKSRLIMEKFQQRTRKTFERKQNQLLSITEDEVNLQAEPNRLGSKGNSIDRYKKEGQNKYSIKELTKSLQMKHERSMESYSKKISKTKTEINQKEGRSNSIMN